MEQKAERNSDTLCPDHFVPHISNIVQAECGLDTSVICLDIAQGCCGFLVGLMQACMLLEHMEKKVVLINGDVLSHKVSKRDRNDFPLIGDGTAITVVENDSGASQIYYEMNMDGKRRDVLKIPSGGFRMPASPFRYRRGDRMCPRGARRKCDFGGSKGRKA